MISHMELVCREPNKQNLKVKTISLLCKHLLKSKPLASTCNHIEIPKANLYRRFKATTVFGEGSKNHSSLFQFSLNTCNEKTANISIQMILRAKCVKTLELIYSWEAKKLR